MISLKSKTKIYIRADGSPNIGLGHLVRCFALAHMLKDEFEVHFISKEAPEKIVQDIAESGFQFIKINDEEELIQQLKQEDIVVVDHYGLYEDYHHSIRKKGCRLVCIDDLHDKDFFSDLIINHSPLITPENYKAAWFTQYCLGPGYALLRPTFLAEALNSRKIEKIETVFVCFGGADSKNLTKLTVESVLAFNRFKRIIIVTGSEYKFESDLKNISDQHNIEHYHSISEQKMIQLMKQADVAIVPASGILLEALAVGCIVISGMYVPNQYNLFNAYKSKSAIISAEDFSSNHLKNALNKLLSTDFITPPIIDGKSGTRLLTKFRSLALESDFTIREANIEDTDKTFEWASNPTLRQFSFNQKKIQFEEHKVWFQSKITAADCKYFLFQKQDEIVGSIRFDIENDTATISYLLDPNFQGKGLSIVLLKKGIEYLLEKNKDVQLIIGFVLLRNLASLKAFEKLNFSKEEIDNDSIKFTKRIYENR